MLCGLDVSLRLLGGRCAWLFSIVVNLSVRFFFFHLYQAWRLGLGAQGPALNAQTRRHKRTDFPRPGTFPMHASRRDPLHVYMLRVVGCLCLG